MLIAAPYFLLNFYHPHGYATMGMLKNQVHYILYQVGVYIYLYA